MFFDLQNVDDLLVKTIKTRILHISDPPAIGLTLGRSLDPGHIKEGDDVYFECDIRSNPEIRRLEWHHNVSTTTVALETKWRILAMQERGESSRFLLLKMTKFFLPRALVLVYRTLLLLRTAFGHP